MPRKRKEILQPDPKSFSPLLLSREHREKLVRHLEALYARCMNDLGPFREKVCRWRDLYEDRVAPGFKPWANSAEVKFPLARMIGDSARARIVQTMFQQRDVAIVEAPIQDTDYNLLTGEVLADDLSALNRFINHVALEPSELNFKAVVDALIGEETQTGSGISRTFHDYRKVARRKVRMPDGSIGEQADVTVVDRVRVKVIPIEQCFWDTTADDRESLRFTGFEFTLSAMEIKQLAKQQGWGEEGVDMVLRSPDVAPSQAVEEQLRRENVAHSEIRVDKEGEPISVSPFARFTFREVWLKNTDVDEDGVVEDIVATWHPRSGSIPYVILFPYIHNDFAFDVIHYEQRVNRNIGQSPIGAIETLCAAANAIVNQTIDAQTIRNCPTIVVAEGSDSETALRDEDWHPGQLLTEREKGETHALQFADPGNTVVSLEILSQIVAAAHRTVHLGEAQLGDVDVAQRAPGNLGMSIMAEGAQLLDKVVSRNRDGLSAILHKCIALYWQVQPEKFAQVLGPDDAKRIERLLGQVGIDKLRIRLNIVSAAHSRELDRANFFALSQVLMTYGKQVLEGVNALVQPAGVDPATGAPIPPNPLFAGSIVKWLRASQTYMRRLVETYPNITDAEPYVPDIASDAEAHVSAMSAPPPPPPLGAPVIPTLPIGSPPAGPGPIAATLS